MLPPTNYGCSDYVIQNQPTKILIKGQQMSKSDKIAFLQAQAEKLLNHL